MLNFLPRSDAVDTLFAWSEWRPGSTGQILSDMDLTSQKEGRWKRLNTLAHYNVSLSPPPPPKTPHEPRATSHELNYKPLLLLLPVTLILSE